MRWKLRPILVYDLLNIVKLLSLRKLMRYPKVIGNQTFNLSSYLCKSLHRAHHHHPWPTRAYFQKGPQGEGGLKLKILCLWVIFHKEKFFLMHFRCAEMSFNLISLKGAILPIWLLNTSMKSQMILFLTVSHNLSLVVIFWNIFNAF